MRGERKSSELIVDMDNNVINGTHRLALLVWYGNDTCTILRMPRITVPVSIEEQFNNFNMSDEERKRMKEIYKKIRKRYYTMFETEGTK